MLIRNINLNDLLRLEKAAQFPMPNLESSLYIIKKTLMDNGLIGSFWVKATTETSLILSPEISKLKKARAIAEIVKILRCELMKLGYDDSHLFIKDDEEYVNFLKKNFDFKDNLGTALYITK